MAKQKVNAHVALMEILGNGKRHTLASILPRVFKKTGRDVSERTIQVRISELRRTHTINTFRGSESRAKDGATQYQLVT